MAGSVIRNYQSADREAVFRIAADTAYFGEPVEAFLEDRRLFCDFFYSYYFDLEPEHAWVACVDLAVAGFLTGCTDPHARDIHLRRETGSFAWRLVRGNYRLGRKTVRYILRLVSGSLRREHPVIDLARFPAHLHVNVAAGRRGQGLGRRLIEAYLEQLCALGLPGVHLNTTSENEVACRLYENMGFRLLSSVPTRVWAGMIPRPVENRVYGLILPA